MVAAPFAGQTTEHVSPTNVLLLVQFTDQVAPGLKRSVGGEPVHTAEWNQQHTTPAPGEQRAFSEARADGVATGPFRNSV